MRGLNPPKCIIIEDINNGAIFTIDPKAHDRNRVALYKNPRYNREKAGYPSGNLFHRY